MPSWTDWLYKPISSHARDSVAIFICRNITKCLHQNRYAPRNALVNTLAPKTLHQRILHQKHHRQTCAYAVSVVMVSEGIKTITNKNKQKGYRRAVWWHVSVWSHFSVSIFAPDFIYSLVWCKTMWHWYSVSERSEVLTQQIAHWLVCFIVVCLYWCNVLQALLCWRCLILACLSMICCEGAFL